MRPYPYGPNRGEGFRLGAFECENEGVYNEVNDRCLSHEKRAQDVPLSSVWWSVIIENRILYTNFEFLLIELIQLLVQHMEEPHFLFEVVVNVWSRKKYNHPGTIVAPPFLEELLL